jgi:hypothetical protein
LRRSVWLVLPLCHALLKYSIKPSEFFANGTWDVAGCLHIDTKIDQLTDIRLCHGGIWLIRVSVFREANSLNKKIPLHIIRILLLKASNKLLESIDCGLEVLEQLGIRFPEATPENTGIELTKTLQMLEGKTTN